VGHAAPRRRFRIVENLDRDVVQQRSNKDNFIGAGGAKNVSKKFPKKICREGSENPKIRRRCGDDVR